MFQALQQLFQTIYNVQGLIQWGGTLMVCGIVFIETGLFAGFFLPGDSLLVTAGIFAAAGHLKLAWLLLPVSLCAIAGDQLGYWIGRTAGEKLYQREDSRFFKRRHLEQAHEFYEKYGRKTIVLARFVPIVRTFCPPVAGAARMKYARFLAWDIFGGIFWVCSMVLAGFFLGSAVPSIDKQIHWVIAVVIFLSLLPAIYHVLRTRARQKPVRPLRPSQPEKE
jgi:membrane-associated protein